MNISKFSFAEAHNDRNGKSSNSKMNGTIIIWTGCLCTILALIGWFLKLPDAVTITTLTIGMIGIGAGLSGYSKKKSVGRESELNN